jgi:putative endonuclease
MAFFMTACAYILYSVRLDKYYVGSTEDIDARLRFHNSPIEARKFTAKGIPWDLQLVIPCSSKATALRLERHIKSMKSRGFIVSLVNDVNFRESFLAKFAPDC